MSLAQKLKSIIKGKEVKVNTFGTDPLDPWSTKAGLAEDSVGQTESGLLKRYLLSRGIDPRYVTKDTRISHSKSGEFLKWKQEHMSEAVDNKDTITFDIPLLIRVLEFAREDLKSDINLHKMVERLLSIRGKGTLTMNEYGVIVKEECGHLTEEQVDEFLNETWKYHNYSSNDAARAAVKAHHAYRDASGMASGNPARAMGNGKVAYKGEFKGPKPTKSVSEAKEANYGGDYQSTVLRVKELAKKKPVDMKSLAARMQASYAKDEKKPVKEELNKKSIIGKIVRGHQLKKKVDSSFEKIGDAQKKGDSAGASKAFRDHERYANLERPGTWTKVKEETLDEGNGYDDNRTGFAKKPREDDEGHPKPKFKPKSLMDRPHTVHVGGKPWKRFDNGHQAHKAAETLQSKGKDAVAIAHFKEDVLVEAPNPKEVSKSARIIKSIYKKQGVSKNNQVMKNTDLTDKPQAAAVLSGGKTMTGSPRDTIEIDPMLRKPKGVDLKNPPNTGNTGS